MFYRNKFLNREEQQRNIIKHYETLDDDSKLREAETLILYDDLNELLYEFVTERYLEGFVSYLERLPKNDLKQKFIDYYMDNL